MRIVIKWGKESLIRHCDPIGPVQEILGYRIIDDVVHKLTVDGDVDGTFHWADLMGWRSCRQPTHFVGAVRNKKSLLYDFLAIT